MKLPVTLILSLSISSISYAQPAEKVVSQALGLEVMKPADWQYLSANENAENLRNIHKNDPHFLAEIAKHANAPVIAFTKYKEPHPDLNPSFKINARPIGQLAGKSAVEILSIITPSLARVFPDIKIEQEARETILAGHQAAYARFSYTLVSDGKNFPTTSEMWIVPQGSFLLVIGAGTRQDEANGTRAEIQSILSTLTIAP